MPPRGELRNVHREFVHSLQRQSGQRDVGRQASGMLAVWNASDFLVVLRTALAGIDDHGHSRQGLQCF